MNEALLTKDEAVFIGHTEWWKGKDPVEIVRIQLYEKKLIMPWGEFHVALRQTFGRRQYDKLWDRADRIELMKNEFEKRYGK